MRLQAPPTLFDYNSSFTLNIPYIYVFFFLLGSPNSKYQPQNRNNIRHTNVSCVAHIQQKTYTNKNKERKNITNNNNVYRVGIHKYIIHVINHVHYVKTAIKHFCVHPILVTVFPFVIMARSQRKIEFILHYKMSDVTITYNQFSIKSICLRRILCYLRETVRHIININI